MIPGTIERVHEDVMARGWALTNGVALGLPAEAELIDRLSPALVPDPRGPGKLHARDIVNYHRGSIVTATAPCQSIAHGDVDDFSRFGLHSHKETANIARAVLELIPPALRETDGRMSADYFRYSPGAGAGAHQDGFGDLVVIWTLDRSGGGAESFVKTLDGHDVMRAPLPAGSVLVFRDELFLHGVTSAQGSRDALIFITLKDGA